MATRRTTLGAAGRDILKRTGADALATATTRSSVPTKGTPTLGDYQVTTIRFGATQWKWLRRQALERAMETGARADASEIVRELVHDAMSKGKGTGR